jgi:hypothetical protein
MPDSLTWQDRQVNLFFKDVLSAECVAKKLFGIAVEN